MEIGQPNEHKYRSPPGIGVWEKNPEMLLSRSCVCCGNFLVYKRYDKKRIDGCSFQEIFGGTLSPPISDEHFRITENRSSLISGAIRNKWTRDDNKKTCEIGLYTDITRGDYYQETTFPNELRAMRCWQDFTVIDSQGEMQASKCNGFICYYCYNFSWKTGERCRSGLLLQPEPTCPPNPRRPANCGISKHIGVGAIHVFAEHPACSIAMAPVSQK